MKQYSKRMVMVHWLTLVLLIAAWFLGDTLAEATDDNKATLAGYIVHAAAGGMILLLAFAQLVLRRKDDTPTMLADAPIYQFAAKAVHYALYAAGRVTAVGRGDPHHRRRGESLAGGGCQPVTQGSGL